MGEPQGVILGGEGGGGGHETNARMDSCAYLCNEGVATGKHSGTGLGQLVSERALCHGLVPVRTQHLVKLQRETVCYYII